VFWNGQIHAEYMDEVRETVKFIKGKGKEIIKDHGRVPAGQVGQVGWKQEREQREMFSVSRHFLKTC
jgi:hypothetical protein